MSKNIPEDFEIEDLNIEPAADGAEDSSPNEAVPASETAGEEPDDETDSNRGHHWKLHLIMAAVIVLIFALAVFKLYRWNLGEQIIIDPNEDTSQFDVETEDYIMHLDEKYLAGREDDGVNTILCIGNEPLSSEKGSDSITSQLAELTGATVYNCGFNNTTVSSKNTVYDKAYPNDAFSLYWLTKSLTLQDYTLLDQTIDSFSAEDSSAGETLNTLKELDMNKVDTLVILYDGSDYVEDRIVTSPYDLMDIGTCSGSLNQSLALLRETYPYIRIIVMSPTFACLTDESGNYLPGSSTAQRNGFLSDYMIAYKNIAVDAGVTFIDNYYGTISEDNYEKYLEDNIHLNKEGRKLIAERIAGILDL